MGTTNLEISLSDGVDLTTYSLSIYVQAQASNSIGTVFGTALNNTLPPMFVSPLNSTFNVTAGDVVSYILPKIFDADNDTFSVSVNLGQAFTFIKYDGKKLQISPKANDVAKKSYPIAITLVDGNAAPKSMKYIIQVFVFPFLNLTTKTTPSKNRS